MSNNPASISQETLEQTKSMIKTLVNEISELSKSDTPADQYFPAILQRIVSALAAVGGAVWLLDEQRRLRLSYQMNVSESLLEPESDDAQKHMRLLTRMLNNRSSDLVAPLSMIGEDQSEGNPTRYLLVVSPLASSKEPAGLIEIFQRPDAPPATQRGYLKFLEQMCSLIAGWLKSQTLQRVAGRQQLWQQADQFARLVHDNLDLRDTAFTIANEGRRLIECDRVSVAVTSGRKAKVIAISGQDTIESRSNIVSSLNRLASRVVAAGEPLWYDGSTEDLPPQLEEAIEEYVDLSHGRTVTVLPIRRPEHITEGDVKSKRTQASGSEDTSQRDIIGALIVEQIETQLSREVLQNRVDLVYEHTCRALANSQTYNQLFLMPVWRALGRASWMFRGSALPKTIAVCTTAVLAIAAMFLVQVDFDLKAKGELQPTEERHVFASVDGEVDEVFVDHGTRVKQGDPLVRLRDTNLEVQLEDVRGKLQTATEQFASVKSRLADRNLNTAEKSRMEGEAAEAFQQIQSYKREFELLQIKQQNLLCVSPIDGVVTTWDVQRVLRTRPVVTGQVLLTVANENGPWHLEIDMPEKRMTFLDNAVNENGGKPLVVDFVQTTSPANRYQGTLSGNAIHNRAEVHQEEGAAVRMRVIPDDVAMQQISRRPGARVVAEVKCGKRSFAFVWFHDIVEWFQVNVWFSMFG